jgi:repressor LexA
MKKELIIIQKRIFDYLTSQKVNRGITPTLAEIALHFGYKNRATVHQHLRAIEKKGYIKRTPKLSRSIEITIEDKLFISKTILAEVAAGNPLTIYSDVIDTVELPSMAKIPQNSFLLKVKGDSLKDAYIFNGDIIIVNPNLEPQNGKIVVAILDNSAVVKRFYKRKNEIELVSENPEYKTIKIDKNYSSFKIVGIVVGVYRNMDKIAG